MVDIFIGDLKWRENINGRCCFSGAKVESWKSSLLSPSDHQYFIFSYSLIFIPLQTVMEIEWRWIKSLYQEVFGPFQNWKLNHIKLFKLSLYLKAYKCTGFYFWKAND